MKKITAFLTAAMMAFSVTACKPGSKETGATLDISLDLSYISEQLTFSGDSRTYGELTTDKGLFMNYLDTSKDKRWHVLFYDAETNETTEMELHTDGKKNNRGQMFTYPDGRTGILYQKASSNTKKWEDDKHDAYIDVYNADLTYAETIPFSLETGGTYVYEFFAIEHEGALHYAYTYRPNGYMYSFSGENGNNYFMEIMLVDEQMELVGSLHIPDSTGMLYMGASGSLYVSLPLNSMGTSYTYNRVNLSEMRLEALDLEIDKRFCGSDFLTGTNGYEFYSYGNYGICGVTFEGNVGMSEQIMDFRNSDFLSGSWIYASALPDGRFIIQESDVQSQNLWISRKRTEEELDVQVITMAGVGFNEQLEGVVTRFNRNHPEYRIMMFDYTQYVEVENDNDDVYVYYDGRIDKATAEAASAVFMNDLMNGIVPDIICTDNLPYVQLANKGIFCDMTELMAKDDRFQEENYVMSFFDSMKYKGQQQTIAFSFFINTIAGETTYVGDNAAMSPGEYLDMINSRPEGMDVLTGFQEDFADNYLSWMQNSFLDTENLTCSFDSPAFVKLLEIGSTLPQYGDWLNYNDMGTLLKQRTFNQPINLRETQVLTYGREPMTLVGYPTTDPNGNGCIFSAPYTVGINAMSQYKDVVWDIFMELLSEETQRFLDVKKETYSFPVLRSALDEDIQVSTAGSRMWDTVTIGANSEEDAAFLMEYIEHATMFYYADPTIMNIISEEASMYFAGDQTAQEAADMIQSRASLYISEQY